MLPLHSNLGTSDQKRIFAPAPAGKRKIVLATNIAETSLTIDDIVYVIDTGRVKETQYDHLNKMKCLVDVSIARANARQRQGRAGRVQRGLCFKLYTRQRYNTQMEEFQQPEMLRSGLEEIMLHILYLRAGQPHSVLREAIDPPSDRALNECLSTLLGMGAISLKEGPSVAAAALAGSGGGGSGNASSSNHSNHGNNLHHNSNIYELTPLGHHLARLPTDVKIGKLILMGALLRCVDPIVIIAAALSHKSPFVSPFGQEEEALRRRLSFHKTSDHLAILEAYTKWDRLSQQREQQRLFCTDNFLSATVLQQIKEIVVSFKATLQEIGFVGPAVGSVENSNSNNGAMVQAALCAGLFPQVVKMAGVDRGSSQGSIKWEGAGAKTGLVHPSTIVYAREAKVPPGMNSFLSLPSFLFIYCYYYYHH